MTKFSLSISFEEQFDVLNMQATETVREVLKDKDSELFKAKSAKEKADKVYKQTLFDTLVSDSSFALVHTQVIRNYISVWGEKNNIKISNFKAWVDDNNKLNKIDTLIDTPSKADAFLNNLYKDFKRGEEKARKTKEEINSEKAKKADLFAKMLATFSKEELEAAAAAKGEK